MTDAEIKQKRRQSIKSEHFVFRLMIYLGVISYKVSYRGDNHLPGIRWAKTYKTRWWHPLTWIVLILVTCIYIVRSIIEAFKEFPKEFQEKTFYC